MTDFRDLPEVASRAFGGAVVFASDDFFAPPESLLDPAPPRHDPAAFGPRGKVYDGWETRRRREPGFDLAVVRLGARSEVHGVVVDTAHFTGNCPPAVGVDAVDLAGYPSVDRLLEAVWEPLVPVSPVLGDTANALPVPEPRPATHLRLTLHPDGGVARLRVHGRPLPDPALLTGTVDLAALEHGGDVVDCSDAYYAAARNLLMPGRARITADGWENARRRDDGNDHVTVRLAGPGVVRRLVVDTTCFVGNAPAAVRVTAWRGGRDAGGPGAAASEVVELLPRTQVQPDTRQVFPIGEASGGAAIPRAVPGLVAGPVVDHVRLDVYPDGGLARLRVLGELHP